MPRGKAKPINHTVFVLDRSGSMGSIRKEAVDAFNEQLSLAKKSAKEKGVNVKFSLVTFSSEVDEPTLWVEPVSKAKKLKEEDYAPNGMTAMLDAVGSTVEKLAEVSEIKSGKASVLVVVISDGAENNSKKWNYSRLSEKIKTSQDTGKWTFTYMGANQDLATVTQQLHIPKGNAMAFQASSAGMQVLRGTTGQSLDMYYSSVGVGATATRDFFDPAKKDESNEPVS